MRNGPSGPLRMNRGGGEVNREEKGETNGGMKRSAIERGSRKEEEEEVEI